MFKSSKLGFKNGEVIIKNFVFESLTFSLFLIIQIRKSDMHKFTQRHESVFSRCEVLIFQETHRAKDQARQSIPGMALVAERTHNKHGSSVFARDGLKINNISVSEEDNVEFITTHNTAQYVSV